MFVALVVSPLFALYHIVVHAVFKALLFVLAGSLIHVNHHYQSTNRLKTKQSTVKAVLLFSGGVLVLAVSKETIIHASNSCFSSSFVALLLVAGSLFTLVYSFNIYSSCFRYSCSSFSCRRPSARSPAALFYSFILPFLLVSSIFLDVFLDFSLSLGLGSLFYAVDRSALAPPAAIVSHFAIVSAVVLSRFNGTVAGPTSNSSLSVPIHQDLFVFMSSYFIKGPANLLEVIACSSQCYNLWHIHYYNTLFVVWMITVLLLMAVML